MKIGKTSLVCALALSLASTTAVVPQPAEAGFKDAFKKAGKKIRKATRKASRKLRSKKGKRVLRTIVGVGAGIAVGKAIGGKTGAVVGAAIVGGVIASQASDSFKRDLARTYGSDFGWAGCISCGKQRIRVAPGRKATNKQRRYVRKIVTADAKELQTALKQLGYYNKRIDGDFGKGSRKAVKEFQAAEGLPKTGRLSAELRALLFVRAAQAGYVREGYVAQTDVTRKVLPQTTVVPVVPANVAVVAKAEPAKPFKRAIRQYRLAASQFDKFSKDALVSGSNSAVVGSTLARDGTIKLTVEVLGQSQTKQRTLNIGIEDFEVRRHPDFASWGEVRAKDREKGDVLVLNAIDTFESEEEAQTWIDSARKKIALLAKLTEREITPEAPEAPAIVTAKVESVDTSKPIIAAAVTSKKDVPSDAPIPGATIAPVESQAESSGTKADIAVEKADTAIDDVPALALAKIETVDEVIVPATISDTDRGDTKITAEPKADRSAKKGLKPEQQTPVESVEVPVPDEQSEASVQLASLIAPAEVSVVKSCSDNIYLSFSFPTGDDPISHYNITPPEDTLMMDNGDATAYFTGTCVQGKYDYQYVYVEKGATKESWKHHLRKGSFEVAGKVEQCDVNINDPTGSATVVCF